MSRRDSYTAANAWPLKVIQLPETQAALRLGRLFPIHAQVLLTERCNLNCSWCSCANDSRRTTMPLGRLEQLVDTLQRWSCKAVTITGGGEPLMYPEIDTALDMFHRAGIEVGLVTNGYLLEKRLSRFDLDKVTWCRISCSDDRGLETHGLREAIELAVDKGPRVDWAFSYVLTKDFQPDRLADYIRYANRNSFTHVRVVSDLLDLENVVSMEQVKAEMEKRGINDSLVIYQGRKEYVRGMQQCLISLLKPVIGADGKIFPCCGAQYALEEPTLNMPDEMCMGTIDDLDDLLAHQKHFDGSICARCYYEDYNTLLNGAIHPLEHQVFV
jgi:organic radical activating enzyme